MTLPQLPDNLYKMLFAIGLFLLGYSVYKLQDLRQERLSIVQSSSKSNEAKDSISITAKVQIIESNRLVKNLALRHKQDPPPSVDDDSFLEKSYNIGIKNPYYKDSIFLLYFDYVKQYGINANRLSHYKNEIKLLEGEKSELNFIRIGVYILIGLGLIFILLGYYGILHQQYILDEILVAQQSNLHKPHTRCQSCGRIFSSIIKFGKEADGTYSKAFCNTCFDQGKFTEPDISIEDIKRLFIKSTQRSRNEQRKFVKLLQTLDRWKTDNY